MQTANQLFYASQKGLLSTANFVDSRIFITVKPAKQVVPGLNLADRCTKSCGLGETSAQGIEMGFAAKTVAITPTIDRSAHSRTVVA